MHLGNRNQDKEVQRKRWLKYVTYVVITGVVISSVFARLFHVTAIFIIAAGLFEMVKANYFGVTKTANPIISILIYLLVAFSFWKFSEIFATGFLLSIYFQVIIFDAFCQLTGQLIGKNKLAPKISAAKTVEGLAGGWVFCILAAILATTWIHMSCWLAIMFGILTGLTSFAGDLLGSYFKRQVKIKDYSNLLPGQGGFLDRFGSLMMTGGFYYLLKIIAPANAMLHLGILR